MFPAKLASKKNQLSIGGIYFIKAKITIKLKAALKLFVLKVVLILCYSVFPLGSGLIKYKPIDRVISGAK